jgi:hypothetical protein
MKVQDLMNFLVGKQHLTNQDALAAEIRTTDGQPLEIVGLDSGKVIVATQAQMLEELESFDCDWNEHVAEEGEEATRQSYKMLVEALRRQGRHWTDQYPDGTSL